jgi:hypothetical protein
MASTKEPKVSGGIALRPVLWERIRRLAERDEKSRNQVMEECLSVHLPHVDDLRKSEHNPQSTGEEIFG